MTWKNESARHSLSARGISNSDKPKKRTYRDRIDVTGMYKWQKGWEGFVKFLELGGWDHDKPENIADEFGLDKSDIDNMFWDIGDTNNGDTIDSSYVVLDTIKVGIVVHDRVYNEAVSVLIKDNVAYMTDDELEKLF